MALSLPPILQRGSDPIPTCASVVVGETDRHDSPRKQADSPSFRLNDKRIPSMYLYTKREPFSRVEDMSIDSQLLTPPAGNRKTSLSSVDTDLGRLFSIFEKDSDDENTEQIYAPSPKNSNMMLKFHTKWNLLLSLVFSKTKYHDIYKSIFPETFAMQDIVIDTPIPMSKSMVRSSLFESDREEGILNIKKIINFFLRKITESYDDLNIIGVLSDVLPNELQLLYDLYKLLAHCRRNFPININDKDIVGGIFKKIKGRNVHYIYVIDDNFLKRKSELNLTGLLFNICRYKEKLYILKPTRLYNRMPSSKTPKLIMYMGIDAHAPADIERGVAVHEICKTLDLHSFVPESECFVYNNKLYHGTTYQEGVPLIETTKEERISMYKDTDMLQDMFVKQLIDAIVGNCDGHPGNIVVNAHRKPHVMSYDFDLSLSKNMTSLNDKFCMINNNPSEYLRRQISSCCHYKGCPKYVDRSIKERICSVNLWKVYAAMLNTGNPEEAKVNIKRFIELRTMLFSNEIKIIDDWKEVYEEIRLMPSIARKKTTYII